MGIYITHPLCTFLSTYIYYQPYFESYGAIELTF